MACGVCGDPGHNRRTHSKHEPVQDQALIDSMGPIVPVAPTGADRAREALKARGEAIPGFAGFRSEQIESMVRAVGRIADEMDVPHGPGCTVAEPCDECRRYIASNEGEKQDTPIGAELIEYFAEVDEVVDAITPEETEQKLAAFKAARECDVPPVYSDLAQLNYAAEEDPVHGTAVDPFASSVVPDEEDQGPQVVTFDDPTGQITTSTGADVGDLQHPEFAIHSFTAEIDDGLGEHECALIDCPDLITPPWRTALGPDEPIRITLPGVYDLTAEQYHDVNVTGDWLSNSDVKKILQTCPAQFQYDRENGVRKTSDAFDFGHVWHARVLGKGEAYRVFEPKKLDGRTAAGREQKAAVDRARREGFTPIYGDQFALIEAMAQAIEADPVPHALLTAPGRQEVCLFWYETIKVTNPHNKLYGQMVQVKRRAMVDHLPDMPEEDGATVTIVDGKTAEDVKPDDDMRKKIYDYAYHRQAETYAAAVEALFNRVADVVFIFQSKKPPHLIVPVELDTPALRVAAAENRQAMEIWAECVATGEWPGYTKGIATSGVPAWIERQFEEELVIG